MQINNPKQLAHRLLQTLLITTLIGFINISVQASEHKPLARTIIVLDASGSMWGKINNKHKISIAREVIDGMMKEWNPNIHAGLIAYGHRKKGDCNDIETLLPVNKESAEKISATVNTLNPKGKTPLSAAVKLAAENLQYTEQAASIVLITDGLETCHMDPCELGKSLEQSGVDFTTHVIGFDLKNQDTSAIQCLAESTGGQFLAAADAASLTNALNTTLQEVEKHAEADILRLALTENSAPLNDITASFEYYADNGSGTVSGERLAYGYGKAGRPTLQAGRYVAKINLGSINRLYPFTIKKDEKTEHTINLKGGIIKLNARLDKNAKITNQSLSWEIYPLDSQGNTTKQRINYAYGANQLFYLPAGAYDIQVKLGSASSSIKQTINPGDKLEQTLDLRAGELSFNATLAHNGETAQGSFGWEVHHFDPVNNTTGKRANYSYGSTGNYVLTAGNYQLSVSAGAISRKANVIIKPGEETKQTIPLDGGYLLFDVALTEDGSPIAGSHSWTANELNPDGTDGPRLTYSYGAEGNYLLPAGPVRLHINTGAAKAFQDMTIIAGQQTKARLILNAAYVKVSLVNTDGAGVTGRTGWDVYMINPDGSRGKRLTYSYNNTPEFLLPAGKLLIQGANNDIKGSMGIDLKAGENQSLIIKGNN